MDYFGVLVVEEEALRQVVGFPEVSILVMDYPIEEVGVSITEKGN